MQFLTTTFYNNLHHRFSLKNTTLFDILLQCYKTTQSVGYTHEMDTNNMKYTWPMPALTRQDPTQPIFHLLALAQWMLALGPLHFFETNMLVSAKKKCRVRGITQCEPPTRVISIHNNKDSYKDIYACSLLNMACIASLVTNPTLGGLPLITYAFSPDF